MIAALMSLPLRVTAVACVASLMSLANAQPALAAERVAIAPLELSGNLLAGREELEAAARKGLALSGRDVVGADEVAPKVMAHTTGCRDDRCWAQLGEEVGATHIIVGSAKKSGATFSVSVRMIEVLGARGIATENNRCDIADCSLAELLRLSVRELGRQTLGRDGQATPPMPSLVASAAPAPAVAAPSSAIASPPGGHAAAPTGRSGADVWPLFVVGTGVLAIGTGAYLVTLDGDCAQRLGGGDCKDFYNTNVAGWALVGAGVVAGAVGLVLYLRDGDPSSQVQVSLLAGPAGAALVGRF